MKNKKNILIAIIGIIGTIVIFFALNFYAVPEKAIAESLITSGTAYYNINLSNTTITRQPSISHSSTAHNQDIISQFVNNSFTVYWNANYYTCDYLRYKVAYTSSNNWYVIVGLYNNSSVNNSTFYTYVQYARASSTTYQVRLYSAYRSSENDNWITIPSSNTENIIQFVCSTSNFNVSGYSVGQYFSADFSVGFNQGYLLTDNLNYGKIIPLCLIPNTLNNIYIYPDTGYKLPNNLEDIIIYGTADDIAWVQQYNNIIITNPTTNFTISGTLIPIATEYTITWNITNGEGSPDTIFENDTNTITITPNSGYNYPDTINYTGTADNIEYYNDTGDIIITNPTSDFTITAICDPSSYSLKAGYYIPNIRAMENISDYGTYVMIDLPHYISKVTGQIVTAEPDNSSYRYNILDNNFAESDARDGILFDLSAQNLGISTVTGQSGSITVNEHIVVYDALNNSFAYSNFYLLHVPNDTSILYDYKDFFIDMGNYITYYALPTSIYTDGVTAGENTSILGGNTTGLISQIFNALFGTIFAVEIFPGFPLYIFILIPVVFGIIGILLWLIRGK